MVGDDVNVVIHHQAVLFTQQDFHGCAGPAARQHVFRRHGSHGIHPLSPCGSLRFSARTPGRAAVIFQGIDAPDAAPLGRNEQEYETVQRRQFAIILQR